MAIRVFMSFGAFFLCFFFCCSPRLGHGPPQSYLRLPLTVGNLRSQSTPFLFKIIWINLMACSNPQTYQHPQGWSRGCRGGTLSIAFSVSEIVDPRNKKGQATTPPILIKFRKHYRYKGSYKCIDTDTRGNLTSFHASFHSFQLSHQINSFERFKTLSFRRC